MVENRSRKRTAARAMYAWAAALVGVWLAATPAAATTVGISGNTLVIGAEPGEAGLTLIGRSDASHFTLEAIPGLDLVIATPGCSVGASGVDCPLSGFTSLLVIGSDGDDLLLFGESAIGGIFAGGGGDDNIFGSTANDVVYGGLGNDILFGTAGLDTFFGGPGDDFVSGVDSGDDDPRFDPLPRPAIPVPEPASVLLLLAGLGMLGLSRRGLSRRALPPRAAQAPEPAAAG
jgi:Ca2+-binding RTX toxin-like protein